MRFYNGERKHLRRTRLPRYRSMFDIQEKVEDGEVNSNQNSNLVEVANVNIQTENLIPLEIKVDVKKPDSETKNPEIKEQKNDNKQNEPELEVSSGGLKLPPKEPNQNAIEFDMFKDEWTLEELLNLNITEIPFLVEKLIPKDSLVVLAGQSEIGKSTLYTQLALAIVRGDNEFLGYRLNSIHKSVLVISTEDGPVPLSFRTNKQVIEASIEAEKRGNLKFIFNYDKLEERIEKYLIKTKVDLIVMDAFGDVFSGGDINASNAVRRYLNNYVNLIQKYRCSILFVHHICKGKQGNKAEKDQLLGSTGIEGKMRNVLMLSIVNDQHQLRIAKGNYINRNDKKIPLYLNFDDVTLTFSKQGPVKPNDSNESNVANREDCASRRRPGKQRDPKLFNQAIQLYKEGISQVEIAKIVKRDKSTICKWINEHKSKPNSD